MSKSLRDPGKPLTEALVHPIEKLNISRYWNFESKFAVHCYQCQTGDGLRRAKPSR
jgi:hypothetical protein